MTSLTASAVVNDDVIVVVASPGNHQVHCVATENARTKNDGQSRKNNGDWKITDWKITDKLLTEI